MKKTYFNLGLAAFLTAGVMMFSGCSQDGLLTEESVKEETGELNADGTFTATFIPSMYEPMTRAKVKGLSTAVQSLKYLIYKDNGDGYFYYTEGNVFGANATVKDSVKYQWPYAGKIQVDLPGGNYKVAFVGNANPKLFGEDCNELLSYTADESGKWEDVRLNMPNIPFSDNNMFYMDAVEVSAKNPVAQVWLERKVCKAQLWRETVASDNGQILTLLLENVVDHLYGDDPVTSLIGGQIGDALKQGFDNLLAVPGVEKGVVSALEEILLEPLLTGLTEAVRPVVVEKLAPLLDETLKMNSKDALLQQLTNPWAIAEHGAVVTFTHVPNALDLDGKVKDFYPEGTKYKYDLEQDGNFRYIDVTGLADAETEWIIGRVDILKKGLVGGLVVDQTIDSEWILDGSLIDTNTEGLTYTFWPNYKYKSVYGLATLNVDESVYSGDGTENLTVEINIGEIANIDDILRGIINGETSNDDKPSDGLSGLVGGLIGGVLGTVGDILNGLLKLVGGSEILIGALVDALTKVPITITLPINVNALGVDTLEVTGTWGEVTTIN